MTPIGSIQTDAVVFTQSGKVAVQKIQMPPPGAGQVRVRTAFSTISAGTEGWVWQNQFTWAATPFPCVPGYQRTGTITALGAGVEGWSIGDTVVATVGQWDGNVPPFWGAHMAEGNTPQSEIYRLPRGLSPIDASGAVVAQVGFNAAGRVHLNPGEWIVVYGDGLIGQFAAQAAKARGAKVALVGHRPARLALARRCGIDAVVDSHDDKIVESLRTLMNSDFAVAILDSVQRQEVQKQYMPLLQPGSGQIVYCGFTPSQVWADMALLQQREITAYSVSGWNRVRLEATLDLMAEGKLRLQPLVTHSEDFRHSPDLYDMIRTRGKEFLGIVLDWKGKTL